jgi:acetyl esterase
MTVHPQVAASLAVRRRTPVDQAADPIAWLNATREAMVAAVPVECGPASPGVAAVDLDADGVRCRLYGTPTAAGTLVYVHGGGWVMGNLETVDAFCARVAATSGRAVLSVDYRLAPEHPYPAPVDDVETAAAWLRREHPGPAAIGGDSAGSLLAIAAARRARDAGRPFVFQPLIYPVVDPSLDFPSYDEMGGYGLDRASMAGAWAAFAPGDRAVPDLSPLTTDLAGMPPTLVITAEFDVLRDEGEAYAAALVAAGVSTVAVRYQGLNHGFARKLALFDGARTAADQVAAALRSALPAL